MSAGWLFGSNNMVSECLHIHVDKCGPLFSCKETTPLRDGPNEDTLPMLDGIHVDISSDAVLSATFGLQ